MINDEEWHMRKPEFAQWYAKRMIEAFGPCMARGIANREVLIDRTITLDPSSFWKLVLEYLDKETT